MLRAYRWRTQAAAPAWAYSVFRIGPEQTGAEEVNGFRIPRRCLRGRGQLGAVRLFLALHSRGAMPC